MPIIKRKISGEPSPTWTIRLKVAGKVRSLATPYRQRGEAKRAYATLKAEARHDDFSARLSLLQTRHKVTVGALIARYLAAGCPASNGRQRPAAAVERERRLLATAGAWWSAKNAFTITVADCFEYRAHRRGAVAKGTGERITELEEGALSNCFHWAAAHRLIMANPIKGRGTIRQSGSIIHCRTKKPDSANELHALANHLMTHTRRAAGYQVLFEALTGLRTNEALALRWDAKLIGDQYEPGYMDESHLYYRLSKQRPGCVSIRSIRLDDPLRPHIKELLIGLRQWRDIHCPSSPWFFPANHPQQHVQPCSFAHTLARAARALDLPERTPHGLRAYYATTRRCQGVPDEQIAFELGHAGGDTKLLRTTYGDPPANWRGLANVFGWLPSNPAIPVAWLGRAGAAV
jgi:integrase